MCACVCLCVSVCVCVCVCGHYTCDMICILKLGERDCLVSGAPGESISWLPRCLARCSS